MTQHKTSNDLTWEELKAFKQHLDNKSPTFCLAKWYQTTLSLHSGYSASCCLQSPKKLNPEEVEQRPSRLHNSREHIQDRMQLLNGIKIPECQVCWDAESQGNSSERSFKSADHWAKDNKDRAPKEIENPTPTYVEVSFSKECQMRCSYCNPDTSSSLAKEFHEHGYYPDSETQKSLSEQESHIYIKAFWKWLPDIYPNLRVLRLTGGEPFLSEETFRFLDYIREHPNKWMNIEFNTNLSFPTTILHRFFKAFEKIPKNHYREVTLYISTDCWGPEAEYIRFGMKTAIIEANIQKLMATFDHINITITSTVSALAVFSFFDLVRKIEEWKGKWGEKTVQLSAYPLIYPAFQSVEILGKQGLSYFKKIESYVTLSEVFSPREKNMISVIRKRCERELSKAKKYEYLENFYRFFHEYDQRKKTHLTQLFPSLKRIFDEGKEIAQQNEKRWRADILGTHPDKAFKAYQELIRVNPHSEENQMALVTGSFWGKALDKESICRPGPFQEKTLIFLAQSLLDPNKLKDVFYTLLVRNPTTKELRRCFLLSIDYIDEKHHHCFYIWQKVALEFSVDKRDWSEINVTIYKKLFHKGYPSLLEHFLSSLLSSPSPHPSLKRVLNDKEMIYAPLIFRETPLSQDLLLKVFSSKFNILAFNFDLFLQHIPPSIDIIQDLWNLAFEYKDKLDIFTKCLKPWKDSLKALPRDPQQGDPFVNARMILTLGLEKWATASLENINDPLAINDLLMTWKDCGLCLDEKVFASLLVKKYKKNSIPYNWMNMAKKTVSKKIFWPFLLKIAPHGHLNGFLTLIKNTPSEFISDKHIMTLLKLSIKDLSKDDPRLWDITNLILTLQFKKNILLQWILSLKEKILFTNPSDSPFYRIFLHLTKNNRSFFIDSLKNHSKDDIFKALYLRDEFFGSKEMWNLKELYDLSLLEPSILNGSLLTFDGQKDVQTIAKIALSDHIHKFCTFFLEGHQNIIWDILLEMAKQEDFQIII